MVSELALLVHDAPPGELEAIRKGIDVYTDGNRAVLSAANEAAAKYAVDTLRPVRLNGTLAVLSKYNQLGDNEFFDGDVRFKVDTQSWQAEACGSHDEPSKDAVSLQKDLDEYIADHYEEATTVGRVFDTKDGLAIVITGRKLSPSNFFNGAWMATYEVDRDGSSVVGQVRVDVHYFEDGNVRLTSSTKVDKQPGSLGKVVKAIAAAESAYQVDLNRTLVNLNENEFKALRRQLPVTRSYMDWDQAATYRLGRELENR